MDHLEKVFIESPDDLRAWLLENHDQSESVWLVTYKKAVPDKYVSREEVLDELLSFCWMDGSRKKLNDHQTMQLISPKKTPHWSKTYKERIARLTREGKMHASGIKQIKEAKKTGMWDFMNDVDSLRKPSDFEQALKAEPKALEHYEAFPDSAKRDILRWIKLAKQASTRINRIKKTVELASQNKRASGTS